MTITKDVQHLQQFHHADNNNSDIFYNDTTHIAANRNFAKMTTTNKWYHMDGNNKPYHQHHLKAHWQQHNSSQQ